MYSRDNATICISISGVRSRQSLSLRVMRRISSCWSTRSDGRSGDGQETVDERYSCTAVGIPPRRITGQYPGRGVRLENRRIFRVLMETHFPWSVFNGKTGFGLLSARRDQRRRRHGRKDPISKNLEKYSTFCEKSFMHRHFPATSWFPTAPSCTPNNPPCTPGAPWVDSDRRRWDSAFFGFPSFPPTRTPHPTTL